MAASVQVLLPVYNGERHLAELVESIAQQEHRPESLLVRDDGSTDGSLAVLRRVAERSNLTVRMAAPGARLGPYRSFLQLLKEADPQVDLIGLADQDDVWLPDKLARAVAALNESRSLSCYGSAVQVTDEKLRPLYATTAPRGGPSFQHSLFENIAPASTLVLPAHTRRFLLSRLPPGGIYPDLWCYQVCVALGSFTYDPTPSLLYRQHGSNALGTAVSTRERWLRRARQARRESPGLGHRHWQHLALLERNIGDLLANNERAALRRLLQTRHSWSASASYAITGPVVRRSKLDEAVLRATFLLPPPSTPDFP
jgi:glycosyltransferase involved in cell wall biosynthesis